MSFSLRCCFAAPLALALLAGCSKAPDRLDAAGISSGSASEAAIAEYDADGDGAIADVELDKVPALKYSMRLLDADGDKKITADEIAARLDRWAEDRVAFLETDCMVTLGGRPLADATVTLVPEKFLGEAVHPATGTTDRGGSVLLSVAAEFLPNAAIKGVQCGFYKVTVTHPTKKIPAKYNAASTTPLGCEVSQDSDAARGGLKFDLSS